MSTNVVRPHSESTAVSDRVNHGELTVRSALGPGLAFLPEPPLDHNNRSFPDLSYPPPPRAMNSLQVSPTVSPSPSLAPSLPRLKILLPLRSVLLLGRTRQLRSRTYGAFTTTGTTLADRTSVLPSLLTKVLKESKFKEHGRITPGQPSDSPFPLPFLPVALVLEMKAGLR
jgi:hypothetical protein